MYLAVATVKGNLMMYNARERKKTPYVGKHTKKIVAAVWNKDNLLAMASQDKSVTLTDGVTGDTIKTFHLKAGQGGRPGRGGGREGAGDAATRCVARGCSGMCGGSLATPPKTFHLKAGLQGGAGGGDATRTARSLLLVVVCACIWAFALRSFAFAGHRARQAARRGRLYEYFWRYLQHLRPLRPGGNAVPGTEREWLHPT